MNSVHGLESGFARLGRSDDLIASLDLSYSAGTGLQIPHTHVEECTGTIPQRGASGVVIQARLIPTPGVDGHRKEKKLVAVKKLTFGFNGDVNKLVERFEKEIKILRKLRHPNIVSLMHFVLKVEKEIAWLVFPWASRGNVKQFLQTGNWEIPERVALIEDVSSGLSFLHAQNPPICHGDLKSLNIVVDHDFKAIIVDFGSARTVSSRKAKRPRPGRLLQPLLAVQAAGHSNDSIQSLISTVSSFAIHSASGATWTTRWASPEVLRGGKTSLASDIWALGWVCWEIITDHLPFHQISNNSGVILHVIQGELPPVRTHKKLAQLRTMCNLLMSCWEKKSRRRPTATECLEVIEQLPSARPSKIAIDHITRDRVRSAALWNALGEINFDVGNYGMALDEFNKSLALSKSENDDKLSYLVLGNIGDIHYSGERWRDAIKAYEEAQSLALASGLRGLDETLLCRLMDSYTELGYLHEAQEVLGEIVIDLRDDQGREMFVASLYKLGKASYELGQFPRAKDIYERARNIHRNKRNYTEPLYSLHHLAILYCLYGRYADAKRIFQKLKIVQDPPPKDISAILSALRKPARLLDCKEKGDWADVLLRFGSNCINEELYKDALATYEEIRHIRGLKRAQAARLAPAHRRMGRDEEADPAYRKGVKFLFRLAELYCIKELYEADPVDPEARWSYSFWDVGELFVDTLNRLGGVYRLAQRFEDAVETFRKARAVAAQEDYPEGKAEALEGLGMTFADVGDYEEAVKRLKRAASIFRNIGDPQSLSKCNLAIQEIEEELDNEQQIE